MVTPVAEPAQIPNAFAGTPAPHSLYLPPEPGTVRQLSPGDIARQVLETLNSRASNFILDYPPELFEGDLRIPAGSELAKRTENYLASAVRRQRGKPPEVIEAEERRRRYADLHMAPGRSERP